MKDQPNSLTSGHKNPVVPSGYLMAGVALFLAAPVSLLAWILATAALTFGGRRWVLALCGAAPMAISLALVGPRMATVAAAAAARVFGAAGGGAVPSWSLLGPLAAWFGRWAWLTAPVGVPAGMVAAAVPPSQPTIPAPEWEARQQRHASKVEARTRKRAIKQAGREGANPRSNALAVSLGGMVASWRIGDLIVPPTGQLGLAWLLIGAPGAGKTTAIERLAYLAGRERRHLVVLDAKGGHDGLARGVVAAYLAGWRGAHAPLDSSESKVRALPQVSAGASAPPDSSESPTIRLFPQERLNIWRGDPQAIVNRLVEVWDWTAESSWYREPVMTALRLALGQPGPACQSSAELVRRLDPGALTRAWEHDPEMLSLVRSLTQGKRNHLADVHIRVGNLVAALAGALDGEHSWEDADCWVVTVPAMVASRDADSALRVMLSDYGHFTMSADRKGRRPSTLIVDEFSAIAGGRRSAIDLLERGRGAGAGVVLAAQSSVALGNEEERARLLAAASCILLFRTPQPAELAALAGTERVGEGAYSFASGEMPEMADRVTVTTRARARVDQDQVRQLPTGEADLIVRGLAERVRIIRTSANAEARPGRVRELVDSIRRRLTPRRPGRPGVLLPGHARPLPSAAADRKPAPIDGPAGVVNSRVAGPPSPPQGQAPAGSPAASLDPAPSSQLRRYRPRGPGGESTPTADHDDQEGTDG